MPRLTKPDWLNNPDLWTPQAQAKTNVPYYTIVGGKICTINPKINGYNPAAIIGKGGITHTMDTYADPSIQLNWLTNQIMKNAGKPKSSGAYAVQGYSRDDMRRIAGSFPLTPISMDEFLEGEYGMPVDAPELAVLYEEMDARYVAAGRVMRHGGTYGSFGIGQPNYWNYFSFTGGSESSVIAQNFKNVLQSQAGARSISGQHFAVFAPRGVGANIKNYIDRPDYAQTYYLKVFEAKALCFGYGRVGGVGGNAPFLPYVDWKNIEGLGGTHLHNGMHPSRRVNDPAGWVDTNEDQHPQVDYDYRVATGFVCGFVLMDGWIQFDNPYRHGTNPLVKGNSQSWSPDTANVAFPNSADDSSVFNDAFFTDQYRGQDAAVEAGSIYNQMAATDGQRWNDAAYQFQGSQDWISPQTDQGSENGPTTSILYHANAFDGPFARGQNVRRGRPDVMVRTKGSTAHYYVVDMSIPKYKRETITIQVTPGTQEQVTIQGGVLYAGTCNI